MRFDYYPSAVADARTAKKLHTQLSLLEDAPPTAEEWRVLENENNWQGWFGILLDTIFNNLL